MERRGFTVHGREYWFTKEELKSEIGVPDEDLEEVWASGKRMDARMERWEELGRIMLEASDVGDWDRYNRAKEERTKLVEAIHAEQKLREEAEAVVTEKEIPTFTPAFLSEVKKAADTQEVQSYWEWIIEPKPSGVTVRLKGATVPHEFFPYEIIEKMQFDVTTGVYRVR